MFRVHHDPVKPAVGYRFDYKGNVVVVSGDTAKSDSVIEHAKGADLLIHEALNRDMMGRVASDRLERTAIRASARWRTTRSATTPARSRPLRWRATPA